MHKKKIALTAFALAGAGAAIAASRAAREALGDRELTLRDIKRFAAYRVADVREVIDACREPLAQARTLLRLARYAGWQVNRESRIAFEGGRAVLHTGTELVDVTLKLSDDGRYFFIDEMYLTNSMEVIPVDDALKCESPTFLDFVMVDHRRRHGTRPVGNLGGIPD